MSGFSYRKTMKHLADTGGIAGSPDGKNTVVKWFNGRSSRFIGFRMSETPQQEFIETTDDEPVPFS